MSDTVVKKTRPNYGYTNDDFVQLWNSCTNVEQVSTKIGMPMPSCQTKAAILRKKGFKLKLFKRGRRVLDKPVKPEQILLGGTDNSGPGHSTGPQADKMLEILADVLPAATVTSGDWEPIKSSGGSDAA